MTGIVLRRDTKLALEATPPVEGELVYATDTDQFGYVKSDGGVINWVNLEENSLSWGQISGYIDDQIDLKDVLATKASNIHSHLISDITSLQTELDNRYLKTDFIDHKTGLPNQPIKTNVDGLIDNSLIKNTTYTLKGQFTPDINMEYPDVTGLVTGDFFLIYNVDEIDGYTYQTGELQSKKVFNNDQLTYTNQGWLIIPGNVNPDAYLRRDGVTPMLGDIDSNNNFIRNLKDPELDQDAVNKKTLQLGLDQKSNVGHSHNPGNGTEIEYEPYDASIQSHINLQNGSNPHKTRFVSLEDTPVSQDSLKPYLGYKGMRVSVNDNEDGLIFEPSSGNSIYSADYIFDNETIEPNGQYDKQLRVNNLDFNQVTEIFISKLDRYLNDRSSALEALEIDDLIGFRDSSDSSYMIFSIKSIEVALDPSFVKYVVSPVSSSNPIWQDGTQLNVEIQLTGEKWFNTLHDTPDNYISSQYKFPRVKGTEDGIEFSTIDINDVGMIDISGDEFTNPSILQQKLNERIGGTNRTGSFILNKSANLVTEETDTVENILGYSIIDGTSFNKTSQISNVILGDQLGTINLAAALIGDVKLNNNIRISSYESTYNTFKNLIKLDSSDDVVLGEYDIKTIISGSNTLEPSVRKDVSGTATDYKIHTDEGFTYQDYYDTKNLSINNQSNIGDLTTLTTDIKDSLVNAINEVDGHVDNHISQVVGNPHNVTKSDVGLGSVDNTADLDKPISNLTQQALDLKADYSFVDGVGITINSGSITNNNVIKWTTESTNFPPFGTNLKYVDISQVDQGIKLSGTIISDVLLYNDFSVKALKENAIDINDTVNLIKRTTTSTGNFYKNNDVQVGDRDVQTVLFSTEALNYGMDPVVRKYFSNDGSGNPGTKDFRIYTTEQYDINDYVLGTTFSSHTGDSSVHFTQNKIDFDPLANDTTVVISGVVLSVNLLDVYIDGVLQRDTTYSVSDNGVDTTITFNNSFAGGEWVRVNYFI